MQGTIETVVGGITYQVTTFNAVKGLKFLQKLLKVVGPSLGELIAASQDDEKSGITIEEEALSKIIGMLVENMDHVDMSDLIADMFQSVTINGQPIAFSQHFAGNYGHLVAVLGTIVKENYSSFFDGSGFGGLQEVMPTAALQSPPE